MVYSHSTQFFLRRRFCPSGNRLSSRCWTLVIVQEQALSSWQHNDQLFFFSNSKPKKTPLKSIGFKLESISMSQSFNRNTLPLIRMYVLPNYWWLVKLKMRAFGDCTKTCISYWYKPPCIWLTVNLLYIYIYRDKSLRDITISRRNQAHIFQ